MKISHQEKLEKFKLPKPVESEAELRKKAQYELVIENVRNQ